MALGDRFLKKVTGKASSQRAMENAANAPEPSQSIRLHGSNNNSVLSSSSSTESGSDGRRLPYPDDRAMPHPQPPAPAPHQRAASKSTAYTAMTMAPSSVSRSVSKASTTTAAAATTTEIIQSGYMLVKKGILKGYEKRFYFLTTHGPDLYSCRDESQFAEWRASGLPVRRPQGLHRNKETLLPFHVCAVLRADRAGENGALDRAIAVIASDDPKCTAVKYLAPTADACENWIRSFHRVQVAQRNGLRDEHATKTHHHRGHDTHTPASASSSTSHNGRTQSDAQHHHHAAYGGATPNRPGAVSAATAVGAGSSHAFCSGSRMSDLSDASSYHSALRGLAHTHVPSTSSASSIKSGSAAATTPASANVVLFVPAAGSAISISDTKLLEATQEMETLVANGAKRPLRGGMENRKDTQWRYGPPEYVLSDLEYIKGKTRDDESTPLESYAESCCQTLIMEATHKAQYAQWTSVRQEYFYMQVNDGDRIAGQALQENDLFGLLYLHADQVDMELRDGEERKDPRAVLSEAFTQGFPFEVLDVYTQPPQCHFAWRHWGRFTGRYRGVKGTGELVEIRGFGQMHIDGGRLMNLKLFFKQRDLFDQLNKAAAAAVAAVGVRAARQGTVASLADAGLGMGVASTTKPAAPPSAASASAAAPLPSAASASAPVSATTSASASASAAAPTVSASASSTAPSTASAAIAAPQREMRSDQLSGVDLISDLDEFNITAASVARARPTSVTRPVSQPMPQASAKRTQLYQQFMPQAQGA